MGKREIVKNSGALKSAGIENKSKESKDSA